MKTISQKQFENAVRTVLNGGTSKLVVAKEEKPFSWSRSKGHHNLVGKVPNNSKYLRNDGRGGKGSDVYLVCYLASGYTIGKTKAEVAKIEKLENEKKSLATKKRQEKAAEMKKLADKLGFKSVAKLKEAQAEIEKHNAERLERAKAKQMGVFIAENGEYNAFKIQDRVKLSRIELVYDCERKQDLF